MNNFLKIPLPEFQNEVVELFNKVLATYEQWDGVTTIEDIEVCENSFKLTLAKSDGTLSTGQDMKIIHEILSSLGFIYEYNI